MAAECITIQACLDGEWHVAAELTIAQPEKGRRSPVELEYDASYVARFREIPCARLSLELPIDFFPNRHEHWPAFLLDMVPMGAARRLLCLQLGLEDYNNPVHDFVLLRDCCPAPIGNLRVLEAVQNQPALPAIGFPMTDVLRRDSDFLDYARECGAAMGGATGAGGEAPKLLVCRGSDGLYYPAATLPQDQCTDHFLVKFPRNQSLQLDQQILEGEYRYYQICSHLQQIVSLETRPAGMETIFFSQQHDTGIRKPSLWLQRFDVCGAKRFGIESLYAMQGITEPGQTARHTAYLASLSRYWRAYGQQNAVSMVLDYLRRDLLNVVLGNTDNHGRNTAILKSMDQLTLAPVYDLAPMCMDAEGITRTSRWGNLELGGRFDWQQICAAAARQTGLDAEQLWDGMRTFAREDLIQIPDLARDYQLPAVVFNHPRIQLGALAERLQNWGLL